MPSPFRAKVQTPKPDHWPVPETGWKSAVAYSVLGTCKLLGVYPENFFNWVLPRLAAATNRTTGLMPHYYCALVKERTQAAPR